MNWVMWCLVVVAVWCAVGFGLVAVWALLVSRRERSLLRQGLLIEATYFDSPDEEAAIARARLMLAM